MGRQYAAILGTIAFVTVIVQGWAGGFELRQTLETAVLSTLTYGAIGYVVGTAAAGIVRNSISDAEIEALLRTGSGTALDPTP